MRSLLPGRPVDMKILDPLTKIAKRQAEIADRWDRKVLLAALGVMFSMVLVLASVLVVMVSAWEPRFFFVGVDHKDRQILHFSPAAVAGDIKDIASEQLLKDFVFARETIDLASEEHRWERVFQVQSDELNAQFFAMMASDNKDSPYQNYKKASKTRAITIIGASKLSDRLWQIEFRSVDRDRQGSVIAERFWVAVIRIEMNGQKVEAADRFVNPWGLSVVAYRISERERMPSEGAPALAPQKDGRVKTLLDGKSGGTGK